MKSRDLALDDTYRAVHINDDLYRVYRGDQYVGQARRGVDLKWYPELPPEKYKAAALHRVVLAVEAIDELHRALSG